MFSVLGLEHLPPALQGTGYRYEHGTCRSLRRSALRLSRQERPAHLLAGSLDPYSHSCASHSPKLISLRHLHHPKGQRDSQNSHHCCRLSASAAPLALISNRPLRLHYTNAPVLFCVLYVCLSRGVRFALRVSWDLAPCSMFQLCLTTCFSFFFFKKNNRLSFSNIKYSSSVSRATIRLGFFYPLFFLCRPRQKTSPRPAF